FTNTREHGIHLHKKLLGRKAAERRVPEPLVAHGADTAFYLFRIADPAKGCGHHVAVLEGGGKLRSLVSIVAQPMQEFRKTPFRRVDTAAPLYRFQTFAVRRLGDLCGFALRTMIGPQVIFAERFKVLVDRNDRGTGGIQRDGFHPISADPCALDRVASSGSQGSHVIGMGLGGILWILALAMERVFGNRRGEEALRAIDNRYANAQ